MEELWKPMPFNGFESSYEISNLGRVRSIERQYFTKNNEGEMIKTARNKGKILKNRLTQSGYNRVSLCLKHLGAKDVYVHRMVAFAFIGYPINVAYQVNHKNGIKNDNRVENLEWVSPSENIRHAFDKELIVKRFGANNKNSKKINQFDINGVYIKSYDCIAEVYRQNNMNISYVISALKGKRESAYKSKWQYA